MRTRNRSAAWPLVALLLLTGVSCLPAQGSEPSQAVQSSQVVSQTGLLPVYGVDLSIDPSWVDGSDFPSKSTDFPNYGVSATFQQVWDTLKPTGFNCVRFPVDVWDAKTWANRSANLCVWASVNGVRLVPILVGSDDAGFKTKAAGFVKALATALRSDTKNLPAYSQILSFQIEDKMNNAGLHGGTTADTAAKLILDTASAVRAAEQDALKDTGIYATPIMANVSFDYELVKAKSMAGATFSDAAYDQACQSTGQFIKQLAAASDIDIINLEWFPGSIGAGSVDKLPDLPKSLASDLGGKQIVFTTGFSTGFNLPAGQKQYCAAAFTNLVQYRAQESADGAFLGMFFHEALDSLKPDPTPPADDLPSKIAQWDWAAKSDELAAMWGGGAKSADLSWWLSKTQNHMGLLSGTTDQTGVSTFTPKAGFDALLQIAGAVTEANTEMASAPSAQPMATDTAAYATGDTSGLGTSGGSYRSKVKEGLFGLIDKVFQKIGDKITAVGTGGGSMDWSTPISTMDNTMYAPTDTGAYATTSAAYTSVSVTLAAGDVVSSPSSPEVGQQVSTSVTVHNQSLDTAATCLSVALVDSNGFVVDTGAQQNGVDVAANGTQTVVLTWTPTQAGSLSLSAEVYDSFLTKLAYVPVSVTVGAASGTGTSTTTPATSSTSSASGGTGGIECVKSDVSIVPSSPQANATVKVKVNLHNTASEDVSGIDLLLVDAKADPSASLLAEVDGNSVSKNSVKQVEVNWTPTEEKSFELAVQVWQGFASMLTEVQLDPISVTAASSGTETSGSSTSGSETSSPTSPTTPAGTLAVKSITFQPTSPKVGEQAVVKIGMKNESGSDVSNLDAYLIDSADAGFALALASVGQVADGEDKNVDLSWQPDTQGQYALDVQLWDAGGMLASGSVDVTVAASTSGGDGGGSGSGTGSSGGSGVIHKPSTIIAEKVPTPIPDSASGPLISMMPIGLPEVLDLIIGGGTPGYGSSVPVSLKLVNTLDKAVSDLSVVLMADGKQVETKSLGTMIPGQSRSVAFGGMSLPGVGKHMVKVMLQGKAGKALSGSVEREFNVSTRMLATTGALSSGKALAARPTVKQTPLIARGATPTVRLVVPPAFSIGGKKFESGTPSVPRVPPTAIATAKTGSTPKILPVTTPPKIATRPVTTNPTALGSTSGKTTTATPVIPGVTPTVTPTTPTVRPTIPTTSPNATAKTTPTIPGVTAPTAKTTTPAIPGVTPTVPANTGTVRPTVPTITPTLPAGVRTTAPVTQPTVPTLTPTTTPTVPSVKAPSAVGTTTPTLSQPTTPAIVRPTVVPSVTPTVKPTPTTVPTVPTTPTVKTTTPVLAPTAPTATATAPVKTTAPTITRTLSVVEKPDLAITSADIRYNPSAPKVGDALTFAVNVRNLTAAAANGATMVCVLYADGAQAARKEFSFNVMAKGATTQQWKLATPKAKQLSLQVMVSHSADSATANNIAAVTLNVTVSR